MENTIENETEDVEQLEWQKVKAAIIRIDQTTRDINLKLSHLIEVERDRFFDTPSDRPGKSEKYK
jgi:hypothetical protein